MTKRSAKAPNGKAELGARLNQARPAMLRFARSKGATDPDELVDSAILKVIEKSNSQTVMDPAALALKILKDGIVTAIREHDKSARIGADKSLASSVQAPNEDMRSSWAVDDCAAVRGGRPPSDVYHTEDELRKAVIAELKSEFLATWEADPDRVLPGELTGMLEAKPHERRAWLVQRLDFELGDFAPWAVDSSFRVRGAFRRGLRRKGELQPPRGVATLAPQHVPWSQRLWAAWERAKGDPEVLTAIVQGMGKWVHDGGTPQGFAAQYVENLSVTFGREQNRDLDIGGPEFLTDRELAIVSILLGNWPAKVTFPAKVGDVLTAEGESMQKARDRHGCLRSADDKRKAYVGPGKRRR